MKKISKIIVFSLIFAFVLMGYTERSTHAAFKYKPGDIVVTNSTSSSGIVGHTGIVIDSNTILHTSGWKSEPYPLTISIKKWTDRYGSTKVTRPDSAAKGEAAAKAAVKYFKGKKINYKITTNPRDIDPNTYCSEFVWYAYYKAGYPIKYPKWNHKDGIITGWYTTGAGSLVKPYDFIDKTIMDNSTNKFTIVDNKW